MSKMSESFTQGNNQCNPVGRVDKDMVNLVTRADLTNSMGNCVLSNRITSTKLLHFSSISIRNFWLSPSKP